MSIESDIAAVTDGTPETIASIRMVYKAAADRAYENLRLLDDAIIEHIQAGGGAPIPTGATTELRATYPKKTTLRDGTNVKAKALRVILESCGGDFDALAELLCSEPYKPGACERVLPPWEFKALFETVSTAKIVEGKRKPVLTEVDRRFITTGATNERD